MIGFVLICHCNVYYNEVLFSLVTVKISLEFELDNNFYVRGKKRMAKKFAQNCICILLGTPWSNVTTHTKSQPKLHIKDREFL